MIQASMTPGVRPPPSSMRIVFDLQACQTQGSHGRGVGRYSECLTRHIAVTGANDIRACLNGDLADTIGPVIAAFEGVLPASRFSLYRHPPVDLQSEAERAAARDVAECLIRRHWLALQPDVLHVAHVFEGFAGDVVGPRALPRVPGLVRSATLYDLIPLRFPNHYLERPGFRHWYYEKLGTLRQFDHLLAISETTRRDAIDLLGIEAARITTIHGGADARFAPCRMTDEAEIAFRQRWGLKRRFVLYTGGDDFRKNLPGALAAYAELPAGLRADLQLVYVCAISPETHGTLLAQAQRCGLGHDEVKVTGYVSDDELIAFYNLCDAFVFPSLYEGFGLPVLEAMQCGAPVLGANNSSIAEIVGRDDALFDARVPAALAERLTRLLTDDGMRRELSRHGVERAKQFTWTRSAQLALGALHEAHATTKPTVTTAGASLIPRRRIAIFTPLPPCRSGVADYNAALLPFLGRYFEVDLYIDDYEVSDPYLRSNFTIRPHQEFALHADDYDAVVYEMGNSEFHAYMLDHLFRHPGIVVLHDAFLSGLYGYLDFNAGESGSFMREMLHSHGSRARRYFAPVQATLDPVGDAMIALPATKSVIDRATGIVSHSPFNRDVASAHYPEGWAAPYRVVNQMTRARPSLDATRRAAVRADLALGEHDLIVCTFGHVVWTKCGNLLLEAFLHSAFGRDPRARLIYVGELAKDDFGHSLEDAITASGIADRVSITGYLDEDRYERFVSVADLAVQLRTHSRGGTPKGVLDCLAHGVPVVVNNAASYEDYTDDVVLKLPAEPSVYALTTLFDRVHREPTLLSAFRQRGRDYVMREHGGERTAAEFALLVDEFTARQSAGSLPVLIGEVGRILALTDGADRLAEPTARALHASLNAPLFAPQRMLVDVSHIAVVDHGTGIQRVVRNVVRWLYCSARPGVRVIAVRLEGDELIEATDWLDVHGLRTPVEREEGGNAHVQLQWGDCLLMLDSSWARYREFAQVFRRVRELHGSVQTVVYDVLPLQLPQCWPPGTFEWFRGWIEAAIEESDALICISRSVADELAELMQRGSLPRGRVRRLGYWHLGCDALPPENDEPPVSDRVRQTMASPCTLLMVGTIEPRKNHALALDAIERLWARDFDVSLCIAGKQGWLVEDFMARVEMHPERGQRLHFIAQPTDEELHHCYRHAAALLFPSCGEGFGLPLIEAAHFGTPIIASDLPVLREVAAEHATYFKLGSTAVLADAIEGWFADRDAGRVPSSSRIEALTWEESAEQLLDSAMGGRWYQSWTSATTKSDGAS